MISSRVNVKYNNLPINPLYCPGLASGLSSYLDNLRFYSIGNFIGLPSYLDNLIFCSIGNFTGLLPVKPVFFKISRAYFLWFKLIPSSVLVTTSPKSILGSQDLSNQTWHQVIASNPCHALCNQIKIIYILILQLHNSVLLLVYSNISIIFIKRAQLVDTSWCSTRDTQIQITPPPTIDGLKKNFNNFLCKKL